MTLFSSMSAGRRACSKKMKRVQLDATVLRGNAGGRCAPDTGGQAARDGQRARANARRRQFQWAREAGVRTGCDGGPTGAQQATGPDKEFLCEVVERRRVLLGLVCVIWHVEMRV